MREEPVRWCAVRWCAVLGALVVAGCGSGSATDASGQSGPSPASAPASPSGAAPPSPGPAVAAPPARDGCPERFASGDEQPWVPAAPTTETPGRLVPDADPVEVLLCRYAPLAEGPSSLVGERLLAGDLTAVRSDLALPAQPGQQETCTGIGGPQVPHLARLRYADGELWLSAVQEPNGCTAAGNGAFVTSTYLGDRLAAAYDSGAWPPSG